MHLAHLCQSFLIPSKYMAFSWFPKYFVYCLYDAFIASILCTTKMGFQFWEQIEVRRSHVRIMWGMERISNQQSWQLVTCGQGSCPAKAEHRKSVSSRLSCNVLAYLPRFACIISTIYHATWLKIINHDHPLTIPKD